MVCFSGCFFSDIAEIGAVRGNGGELAVFNGVFLGTGDGSSFQVSQLPRKEACFKGARDHIFKGRAFDSYVQSY